MNQMCKGPQCDSRDIIARGLCAAHYAQLKRRGVLKPVKRYTKRPTTPEGYAYCKECKNIKPLDSFNKTENGGPRYICKACQVIYNKKKYHERKKAAV